jgi:predicted RNase H-like HicB family nuclease
MPTETKFEIKWSDEDDAFLAIDLERPGCSAVGDSVTEAYRELQDARAAWDSARAAANKEMG